MVGAVEPWATTGGVRQATLLHTEELEELRRQLAEAERTADAARLAAFAAPASIRREDRVCPVVTRRPKLAPRPFIDVLARESSTRLCELRWFPD